MSTGDSTYRIQQTYQKLSVIEKITRKKCLMIALQFSDIGNSPRAVRHRERTCGNLEIRGIHLE